MFGLIVLETSVHGDHLCCAHESMVRQSTKLGKAGKSKGSPFMVYMRERGKQWRGERRERESKSEGERQREREKTCPLPTSSKTALLFPVRARETVG